MKQSIADGWKDYESRVIPTGAGPLQLFDMKLSFYAGAQVMLHCMFEGITHDSDDVTPADQDAVESLVTELRDFASNLDDQARRAYAENEMWLRSGLKSEVEA